MDTTESVCTKMYEQLKSVNEVAEFSLESLGEVIGGGDSDELEFVGLIVLYNMKQMVVNLCETVKEVEGSLIVEDGNGKNR